MLLSHPHGHNDNMSSLQEKVKQMRNQSPIVAFIKGEAARPYCKFSKQLVQLLVSNGIVFTHINVREIDQDLYDTIKQMANFPTFPQVYMDGELIGGLDIVSELLQDGTLQKQISQLQEKYNGEHKLQYIFPISANTEDNKTLVQIRLSNGTFIMNKFSHSDTFAKIFKFAGEGELKVLMSTELSPFVLCSAYPFEAYDSRSLSKTLKDCGYTSDVTLMVYYPSKKEVSSEVNVNQASSIENNQAGSRKFFSWQIILFSLAVAGISAIVYSRRR